ncbi:MAG: cupin domain-containing protein [Alphaproteobacteria bacterium]
MSPRSMIDRSLRRVAIAGAAAAMTLAASAALAGQCPADKVMPDAVKSGETMPKDVTDTVLATVDLSKEAIAANDRQLRMRRLEIKPGGVVPWHNHADRPAIIYIIKGTIIEHASNCAVPIVHKAGEVSKDAGLSHWWKNTGKETVVLISADILHDPADKNM